MEQCHSNVISAAGKRLFIVCRSAYSSYDTCVLIFISALNCIPRLRACLDTVARQMQMRIACYLIFLSCWAEPNTITSLCGLLTFMKFAVMYVLISDIQYSIRTTATAMSSWRGVTGA